MRVVVLRSRHAANEGPRGDYAQEFDTRYADRVIGNLVSDDAFCTACGPDCTHCRRRYQRGFGERLVAEFAFPAVLPYVLENPAAYVPRHLPRHDVLIAISIHEQILIECLKQCHTWGTRGAVVPIEAGDWISRAAIAQAEKVCAAARVEIAFPKPFCNFRPPAGGVLARFRESFHLGFPEVELAVASGRISKAEVKVSAPCGATYHIARWLVGKRLEDDLRYGVCAKRLHSYPCTGSMAWDDELHDTILHVAGQNHYTILDQLGQPHEAQPELVVSPTGKPLPRVVPPAENLKKIEAAKAAILQELDAKGALSLAELRRTDLTPAAVNSALIILKQEGRIRMEGGRILTP